VNERIEKVAEDAASPEFSASARMRSAVRRSNYVAAEKTGRAAEIVRERNPSSRRLTVSNSLPG